MMSLEMMVNFYGTTVEFFGFDEEGAVIAISDDPFEVWNHKTFKSLDAATTYFYKRGFRW